MSALRVLVVLLLVACDGSPGEVRHAAPGAGTGDSGDGAGADTGTADSGADTADTTPPDRDDDGVPDTADCAPDDPSVHPGAAETCDGMDDDCDGVTDPSSPGSCPAPSTLALSEGTGLVAIDASNFVLSDDGTSATNYALIGAMEAWAPAKTLTQVLDAANRDAVVITAGDISRVDGFARGFEWNSGDEDVAYWVPQGVTGTFDAVPGGLIDGRRAVVVSWHYDVDAAGGGDNHGVRISIADITGSASVKYRNLLLVEPTGTVDAPSFKAIPIHAGGIAWVGDYLYVADTSHGLRVFDMRHILQVKTDDDDAIGCAGGVCHAYGYNYALPQVTRYALPACGCPATFSFVGYDASSSPPSLVTGEYSSDSIDGVILRWPLDPATSLPASPYVHASEAFVAQQDRLQGVASRGGEWWLSCSTQDDVYGRLYHTAPATKSTYYDWTYGTEDLAIDVADDWLWTVTEFTGDRVVIAVKMSSIGG